METPDNSQSEGGSLSYPTMDGKTKGDGGSLSYPNRDIQSVENQQTMTKQGSEDNSQENQQLAESGEFDQLTEQLNSSLTELDMQEVAKEIIETYTEYANIGSPEWRIWACEMLNWHNELAKRTKGIQ